MRRILFTAHAVSSALEYCYVDAKPPGWQIAETREDGRSWINKERGLAVIASHNEESDGHIWLHLSMSYQNSMPTYEDLKYLKRHWAGANAKAIEVHVADSEHVNINPDVRHLWVCLTGDILPNFTGGGVNL